MANRRTRRRGDPLKTVDAVTAKASGRAVNWRVPIGDHESFHDGADERGVSASELAREIVDRATVATVACPNAMEDEFVYLSARFSFEQIERISQAAAVVALEPTVWLRLMTSRAGEVLLKQLEEAWRARRGD